MQILRHICHKSLADLSVNASKYCKYCPRTKHPAPPTTATPPHESTKPCAGASILTLHLGVVTNKLCPSGSIQGSLAWDLLLQPRNRWCSASHNTELDRSQILMMHAKITTPHKTHRKKRLFKDATHFF